MTKANGISKVTVSEKALLRRVNRILKRLKRGQMYKVQRRFGEADAEREHEFGRYFIAKGRTITDRHINIVSYARALGAIKPFEEVEES